MGNLLYEDITYEIRGACFEVYNTFGSVREKSIERALKKEIETRGFGVKAQVSIELTYKGEKIGVYVVDLVVENKIMIEIKSKPILTKEDKKQFWSYLKQSEYKLGFLVNFSPNGLSISRY